MFVSAILVSEAYLVPQDELYEYCHRVRRTIAEVMTEFREVRIPQEYIFDVFPSLRPREFSIASSVKVCPTHKARLISNRTPE